LVLGAEVPASDVGGAGLWGLPVAAAGGDAEIDSGSVWVRAEKAGRGLARTYVIGAIAIDMAGNATESSGECVVPHAQAG
jgi:hypothetical protein